MVICRHDQLLYILFRCEFYIFIYFACFGAIEIFIFYGLIVFERLFAVFELKHIQVACFLEETSRESFVFVGGSLIEIFYSLFYIAFLYVAVADKSVHSGSKVERLAVCFLGVIDSFVEFTEIECTDSGTDSSFVFGFRKLVRRVYLGISAVDTIRV